LASGIGQETNTETGDKMNKMITEFRKRTQVAFISYSLGACYLTETLAQFPEGIAVKSAHGWQIWI